MGAEVAVPPPEAEPEPEPDDPADVEEDDSLEAAAGEPPDAAGEGSFVDDPVVDAPDVEREAVEERLSVR